MLTTPFRYCIRFRHLNGVVDLGNIVPTASSTRSYAKDKECCPDIPQTDGRKVEPWPKPDPPPPAWRCECPREPQPPNYDPYKIKVPDVVVPPIPASNAKWTGVVFTVDQQDKSDSPAAQQQPDPQQPSADPAATNLESEEEPQSEEGFFATLKSYFGFGKRKKGDSDVSMIGILEIPTEDGREPFNSPVIDLAAHTHLQDLFHDSPIVHPDYWKDKIRKVLPTATETEMPRLGYHGRSKYKYAFHEPWKPLDRLSLIAQAEKDEVGTGGVPQAAAAEESDKQAT